MAGKNLGGRPTAYREDYPKVAAKLCKLGATDKQLADFFEVCVDTIYEWKKVHPAFSKSLKESKKEADEKVVRSLYERATGYSHPEDKIFNNGGKEMIVKTTKHYAPDTVACIFWLKNRDQANWRDKHEQELTGNVEITKIERIIIDPKDTNS